MTMNLIEIQNRSAKVKLNDAVRKDSADKLIEELDRLYGPSAVAAQMVLGDVVCSADNALESVDVEINSPGGSVFEGHRIYNALREMSARGVEIRTTVNGMAASMGSVILMAGDVRSMTKQSQIMIHEASTMAMGDARALKKSADLLENISSQIAAIYAERTGGEINAIRQLMFDETWMDSNKAMDLAFVHSVVDYDKDKDKEDAKASSEFDIRLSDSTTSNMSLLAKLFPGNDEAAKIEAAIAENDSLRAELQSAQARIDELKDIEATIAVKDGEITALKTEKDEVANSLSEAQTRLAEAEAKIAAAESSASAKAIEVLATIGQPEPLPANETEESDVLAQFDAITDPGERTRFYNSNRKAIIIAQNKKSKTA